MNAELALTIIVILAAALLVIAALTFWKLHPMKVWQCLHCSQFYDESGTYWTFRPVTADYQGADCCPLCNTPAIRLGWDKGSQRSLAEYFQDGATESTCQSGAVPSPKTK